MGKIINAPHQACGQPRPQNEIFLEWHFRSKYSVGKLYIHKEIDTTENGHGQICSYPVLLCCTTKYTLSNRLWTGKSLVQVVVSGTQRFILRGMPSLRPKLTQCILHPLTEEPHTSLQL